jgi:hypothetical protein
MAALKLPIPLSALDDCGAILGKRGAGKSGTGRAILEHELNRGHRCCALDPKGDWWGIRADKVGNPSRFEIPVFGGPHADVPIDAGMGEQLGRIVATSGSSSVIDLSGFSRDEMLLFMEAFAEALFVANRHPLTLLIDEADLLAPQKAPKEVSKLLFWMEALIRQGRQRGIFMWMLTQRPASINKSLLSMVDTMIAMKMTGPQDRGAIRDWMDGHDPIRAREVEKSLAHLAVGEAYAWVSGADFLERVQFPLYETYDSGRTPKHGEIVGDVALKALDVAELAAALKGEGAPQDEAAELRAELARSKALSEQLRREADAAEARTEAAAREIEQLLRTLTDVQDRLGAAFGSAAIEPLPAGESFDDYLMLVDHDGVVRPFPRAGDPRVRVGAARRRMEKASAPPTTEDLRRGVVAAADAMPTLRELVPAQRRIVAAAATAGGELMSIERIAELADVSPTSSNMTVGLKRLVERGLLRSDGQAYAATPAALPQETDHA